MGNKISYGRLLFMCVSFWTRRPKWQQHFVVQYFTRHDTFLTVLNFKSVLSNHHIYLLITNEDILIQRYKGWIAF